MQVTQVGCYSPQCQAGTREKSLANINLQSVAYRQLGCSDNYELSLMRYSKSKSFFFFSSLSNFMTKLQFCNSSNNWRWIMSSCY